MELLSTLRNTSGIKFGRSTSAVGTTAFLVIYALRTGCFSIRNVEWTPWTQRELQINVMITCSLPLKTNAVSLAEPKMFPGDTSLKNHKFEIPCMEGILLILCFLFHFSKCGSDVVFVVVVVVVVVVVQLLFLTYSEMMNQ